MRKNDYLLLQNFSIRKYSVGVVSVILGASIVSLQNPVVVEANQIQSQAINGGLSTNESSVKQSEITTIDVLENSQEATDKNVNADSEINGNIDSEFEGVTTISTDVSTVESQSTSQKLVYQNIGETNSTNLDLEVESNTTDLSVVEASNIFQERSLDSSSDINSNIGATDTVLSATEREVQVKEEVESIKNTLPDGLELRPTNGTDANAVDADAIALGYKETDGWKIIDEMRDYHITDQASLDKLAVLSRNDLTKVVLTFENDSQVIFPAGVYYTKDTNFWLKEGHQGSIDLSAATFVLDTVTHDGYSMSIRATGDQKNRSVIGGTFIGSVETKSVDISNPNKVSINQSTGYIYNSLIKARNLNFDGQTYINAIQMGSHAYDLNGVDNISITNNTFSGYGGKENWTSQELGHITPIEGGALTSNHLIYSEAIQIDIAEKVAAGLSSFNSDLTKINGDKWPSHSNIYGFVEKNSQGQYVTNKIIIRNCYIFTVGIIK